MKVAEIARRIDSLIPLKLAQGWDNVGLLIGDANKPVTRVLLTIDTTKAVVAEARRLKTDMIVSYHPVIWDGLKQVLAAGPSAVVHDLVRAGIAVFSIHTALDTADGGVNDGLAAMLGIMDAEPLGDYVQNPAADKVKLVVFTPPEALAAVSNAMFAAGAGVIGNYTHCSYYGQGTGTFRGGAGSKPAVGRKGRREEVAEMRLEAIVPGDRLQAVVAAMTAAHPYETPAFDCYRLMDPGGPLGLGRIGPLAEPMTVRRLIARIKRATGARAFGIVGDDRRLVRTAAVCAGTCGAILNTVIARGADLYLTGELKHHQALAAAEAGLTCICLSHTVSERFILKKLAKQLRPVLDGVKITLSTADADPFTWVNV